MIISKLPQVGTTIFSVMSKLAVENNAINLAQGFPDFSCDPHITDLVNKYMKAGHNQYAPMPGIPVLREKVAQKTAELYGFNYNLETEITVTSGATEALYAAITASVHRGDEVIITEPCYDSYVPAIELSGGVVVPVKLNDTDYSLPHEKIKNAITPKTRLIIINTPHNPSGSILKQKDLVFLEGLLKGTNILMISDEVYEHIIFDNQRHESVIYYPALRERSFVISSFGKTYHTTGWKIGYCLAPKELSTEFRKVHQFLTFSSHTPTQYAIAEYMDMKDKYIELGNFYKEKRDYFRSLFTGSRFKLLPCEGTYFQLMSYAQITDENDYDYAIRLTKEHGVASIPTSVFYSDKTDNRVLRFCFAKEKETLEKAAERLCRI